MIKVSVKTLLVLAGVGVITGTLMRMSFLQDGEGDSFRHLKKQSSHLCGYLVGPFHRDMETRVLGDSMF